jgi:hypothetical protein
MARSKNVAATQEAGDQSGPAGQREATPRRKIKVTVRIPKHAHAQDDIPSPFRNRLSGVESMCGAWQRSQRHGVGCWKSG